MIRRLLNLLTALSLLVCMAILMLWVRSYSRSDWIAHRSLSRRDLAAVEGESRGEFVVQTADLEVWTGDGNVRVSRATDGWYEDSDDWRNTRRPEGWSWWVDKVEDPAPVTDSRTLWNRLGFDFEDTPSNGVFLRSATTICLPLWLPALLVAAPATLTMRHIAGLLRKGHCPACGYDVRATPGRCPECGTPAASQPALKHRLLN